MARNATSLPAYAFGSDGRFYAPIQGVNPDKLRGRTRCTFYRLTREEEQHAQEEIRLISHNVTVGLPHSKRRHLP